MQYKLKIFHPSLNGLTRLSELSRFQKSEIRFFIQNPETMKFFLKKDSHQNKCVAETLLSKSTFNTYYHTAEIFQYFIAQHLGLNCLLPNQIYGFMIYSHDKQHIHSKPERNGYSLLSTQWECL